MDFGPQKPSLNCKVIDHYVLFLKEVLGTGSYGSVYRGLDLLTKTCVAIKQVTFAKKPLHKQKAPQMTQALRNETTNMRIIDHPNVVKLFDVKKSSNNYYLVCEYCSQGSLENYMASKGGQLSIAESMKFLRDIVDGFKCLYTKSIVHRDMKPANLLLHRNRLKIADFGFSKLVDHAMDAQQILSQVGSPLYMSPQILRGECYSSKTDIWSLGIILYQMIYGQTPWKGKSSFTLLREIEENPLLFPKSPPVPKEIRALLTDMLHKEEKERVSWESLFSNRLLEEEQESSFNLEKSLCELDNTYKKDEFLKYKALNQLYFQQNRVVGLDYQEEGSPTFRDPSSKDYEEILERQLRGEKRWGIVSMIAILILHRRNKLAFLGIFAIKLLDLVISKSLILRNELYHRFLFLTLKAQMMGTYKLYMRVKSEDCPFKRFAQEDWQTFLSSETARSLLKTLTTDLTIVKSLFTRALEDTQSYIASKSKNLAEKAEGNPRLKALRSVCDNSICSKVLFEPIFDEMLRDFAGYYYTAIKKTPAESQQVLLEFGYWLKIVFNRRSVFQFRAEEPLDYLKFYEEIESSRVSSLKEIFTLEGS